MLAASFSIPLELLGICIAAAHGVEKEGGKNRLNRVRNKRKDTKDTRTESEQTRLLATKWHVFGISQNRSA